MEPELERQQGRGWQSESRWVDIVIFNFCVVAFLGFLLRSKILFSIPFLDYNRLLDAHFHFAFSGWVTLALAVLLIHEVLPPPYNRKHAYKWILVSILSASWLLLISSPLPPKSIGASLCAMVFILVTYVLAGFFIPDMLRSPTSRTVKLLSISAIVCLVLSSAGIFALSYLFATKSLNPFAYRDALYTYLHFQYNGFFTLAVFAILFHHLEPKMKAGTKLMAYQFAAILCISTLLSLFLTYLWRDPNEVYRFIAIGGSITLLLAFVFFIRLALSAKNIYASVSPLVRNMIYLSLCAFILKIFLQSFTLFPAVGNAVFGDRPVIIGFLHLVFLGFVTLFLMARVAQKGYLDIQSTLTGISLTLFTVAVILNEVVLMTQGLGAMLIISSTIFPWLLWGLSILLFISALLIAFARIRTKKAHV
jgi:hypothetical protein